MILLEMQRIKGEGADEGEKDWFVKLETKAEELVYDRVYGSYYNYSDHDYQLVRALWDKMVNTCGVNWGEDDVYAYIYVDSFEPEVGEEYQIDDITWVRVA